MAHTYWHWDAEINPLREANAGEYVFLYDRKLGHGLPVQIVDTKYWLAKTFGYDSPPLFLATMECD